MIFSDLKAYLKTKYSYPSLDFKWSEEDNKEFFAYIRKILPEQHTLNDENKLEIKRAFKEYFEPVGYIVFQLKDKQIRLKVLEYKIDPKDSINLDSIIDILESNEELIEFDYKGNENQIFIPIELKNKIYDFVRKIENEEVNKIELIKYAIREAFELLDSDIIVIKENAIFIKLLSNLKRKQVASEEKETIANRYNGIDEEELELFYKESFLQEDSKDFFYLVAKTFVDIYFIEEKIDNANYEKNVFSYVQEIIIDQLIHTFEYNEDFFIGLSGYIFRIHFKEVFADIADFILHEISISNAYMVDFLKYYSLNIVVLNGVKYKVPELEADNGLKWNVISIMSVAKVYMKVKSSMEDLQAEIYDIDDELYEMFIDEQTPVEYNNDLFKSQNELTEEIAQEIKELKIYSDKYDYEKNADEKKRLKTELQEIKDNLEYLKEKKDSIASSMVDKRTIANYRKLEKDMDSCLRQLKAEERILSQNVNSYKSVKNALTKVLISKKKKI